MSFAEIATTFLINRGYEPYLCKDEVEARSLATSLPLEGKWPCLFSSSNTTGEKDFEEFYTENENLDMKRFENLGVIKNEALFNEDLLNNFENQVIKLKKDLSWDKDDLVAQFTQLIPEFRHNEMNKYLDNKM